MPKGVEVEPYSQVNQAAMKAFSIILLRPVGLWSISII